VNIEFYRNYCLNKPGATEDFPFDTDTLVFKVGGKIFALLNLEVFDSINLKCHPERAVELRERYSEVIPGYHMNKNHWNTISVIGSIADDLILEWTDDSYELVVRSLPKKLKEELEF